MVFSPIFFVKLICTLQTLQYLNTDLSHVHLTQRLPVTAKCDETHFCMWITEILTYSRKNLEIHAQFLEPCCLTDTRKRCAFSNFRSRTAGNIVLIYRYFFPCFCCFCVTLKCTACLWSDMLWCCAFQDDFAFAYGGPPKKTWLYSIAYYNRITITALYVYTFGMKLAQNTSMRRTSRHF